MRSAKALVIHNNKLLLIKRDDIPSIQDPNRWSGVGGEVEEGETFLEGLKREFQEEVCIIPENINYIGKISIKSENGSEQIVALYICYLTDYEKSKLQLGNEGQEIKLFNYEELKDVELAKNWQFYLDKYGDYAKRILSGEISIDKIDPANLGLEA